MDNTCKLNFCFIRKNTPEIRERLKKLGIPQNDFDEGNRPWIAYNHGLWISVDEGHDKLFCGDIDCGYNEDLFFALITYNNKIYKNQWFIFENPGIYDDYPEKIWVYIFEENEFDKYRKECIKLNKPMLSYHKATIEELIEHFK